MRPGFFHRFALLALLLAPGIFAVPALAQERVQPLDRLLPQIRRAHPGQFYDAEGPLSGPDGSQHYHLKWLTPDGRVVWYDADARTGRVLRMAPGRDTFDTPFAEGGGPPPPGERYYYERRGDEPPEPFYRDGGRGYDRPFGGGPGWRERRHEGPFGWRGWGHRP